MEHLLLSNVIPLILVQVVKACEILSPSGRFPLINITSFNPTLRRFPALNIYKIMFYKYVFT